jgi:error-prone DNA polymerase
MAIGIHMESLLERWGWHEWLSHSNFSFLIGASHPREMVDSADELRYRGLGICDFDGIYGIVRAHRAQQKRKLSGDSHGLKIFYGSEVHFEKDHSRSLILQNTVAIYARNLNGYKNLCGILNLSHQGGKHEAHISLNDLCHADLADLVAILPMRGLVRRGSAAQDSLLNQCHSLKAAFDSRFYLSITRSMNPVDDVWIRPTLELARHLNIPVLISQDAFFHDRCRKPLSDTLHAIRHNLTVDQVVQHMFVNSERCLHSLRELTQIYQGFSIFERSLIDSYELAQSFSLSLDQLKYQYPQNMIPAGHTAQSFLEKLAWGAAFERYGDPLPNKIFNSISHELRLVAELGFADYFLTVWDIVRWARSQNILCQGRGSAANSSICFVLGITAVDPARFDLLFERFISAERGDPPDIDVDFEHERREEVIQYIYRRFGRSHAAMVANVICFKTRGALRSTGLALGIPESVINIASKLIDHREFGDDPIRDVIGSVTKDPRANQVDSVRIESWMMMAKLIKGFPRHMGIHSGGFVISQDPIHHLCAQEPASMPGRSVIQWSKEDIEALGFFKIDVLALGMLSAIRKTLQLISDHYGNQMQLHEIPHDDASTYAMIQRADTIGTFQVESRAQMSMLPRLRPKEFYDLVVEVGIVRPGPIQGGFIHPYLKRRRGEEAITYPHPSLKPILERTMGIPIFQEQVMRMAMAVGDFSPGEADELRRQMGAWQFKGDLSPMLSRLQIGMKKKNIHPRFIEQVTRQIQGFAEYGFPESHAASFALLAYASCYLKCHYAAAFTTALLNSQPMGFYSPHALIQDALRHQIEILPVCAQNSDYQSKLEVIQKHDHQSVYAIRLGLHLVTGLRKSAAEQFVSQRKNAGNWQDLRDFLQRTSISRSDLTCLAAANALACFGMDRRSALWLSEAVPVPSLLDRTEDHQHSFREETARESMQNDFHSTSTTLGKHPTRLIRDDYWSYDIKPSHIKDSNQLQQCKPKTLVQVFGMVLIRQQPPSAKGMVFITLEDEFGYINLVFDPQCFGKFRHLINGAGFICAQGELQNDSGSFSILVKKVHEAAHQQDAQIHAFTSNNTQGSLEVYWSANGI